MQFRPTHRSARAGKGRGAGFTLAEVLAALVLMAIVIPAAVEGVRIAGRAGVVAQRKAEALMVSDRVLNEAIITSRGNPLSESGSETVGAIEYRWQLDNALWEYDSIRLITIRTLFAVQGQDYDVSLSTLVDAAAASGSATGTQ